MPGAGALAVATGLDDCIIVHRKSWDLEVGDMKLRSLAASVALASVLIASAQPVDSAAFPRHRDRDAIRAAYKFWKSIDPRLVKGTRYHCSPRTVDLRWRNLDDAWGRAPVLGCQRAGKRFIKVDRSLKNRRFVWPYCVVVVHEFGHLVGFGHSKRRNTVMWGGLDIDGHLENTRVPRKATLKRAKRFCRRA